MSDGPIHLPVPHTTSLKRRPAALLQHSTAKGASQRVCSCGSKVLLQQLSASAQPKSGYNCH